jgi:zinc/manganese transport system permease protein
MFMLGYSFLQNALLAGSCIAVASALTGYFLVSRGLTFASHALPNVGFAGAAGAVLAGIRPVYGMFVFTIIASIGVETLGRDVRERDTSIGVLMTFALGLGLLFLNRYHGYAERVYSILFGTILGISRADVLVTALATVGTLAFVLIMYRPLVFSTFDPAVAEARGIPVRFIGYALLVLAAVTVSISIQVMGAILVFTLIAGPAATAIRITRRPVTAIAAAALLGIAYVWGGVALATATGDLPVSFFVASIAFAVYLPVRIFIGDDTSKRAAHGHHHAHGAKN